MEYANMYNNIFNFGKKLRLIIYETRSSWRMQTSAKAVLFLQMSYPTMVKKFLHPDHDQYQQKTVQFVASETSYPLKTFCKNSPTTARVMSKICTIPRSTMVKISPVGDWRSTSLEWPWPWPWFRPYCIPSCITHRPLPIYQISLRSEENFFSKVTTEVLVKFRVTWHKN